MHNCVEQNAKFWDIIKPDCWKLTTTLENNLVEYHNQNCFIWERSGRRSGRSLASFPGHVGTRLGSNPVQAASGFSCHSYCTTRPESPALTSYQFEVHVAAAAMFVFVGACTCTGTTGRLRGDETRIWPPVVLFTVPPWPGWTHTPIVLDINNVQSWQLERLAATFFFFWADIPTAVKCLYTCMGCALLL